MASAGMIVSSIANVLHTSKASVLLLISLALGYPFAFIYRKFLFGKAPDIQHAYFILCGIFICYINFGQNMVHSLLNTFIIYAILKFLGGTQLSVALAFSFNIGYLVIGYLYTATENYDIKWTTPHCVLTLRLSGLAWDVFDGQRKRDELSSEQKQTALKAAPSFLEVFGHTYHFGGFMIGPQFPMSRYLEFTHGSYKDRMTGGPPASISPGIGRLFMGVLYLAVFQIGSIYVPNSYMVSSDFDILPLWQKLLYVGLWGKIAIYKYVACWLITEGSCIITGLTYNGKDKNGNDLWDGCANVKIRQFEKAATFQEVINSFNINTNLWMGKYCYKRLKFLGNKNLSQAITLLFLSMWHGTSSGYFMNFALEFFIMKFENDIQILSSQSRITLPSSPIFSALLWGMKKLFMHVFFGYPLLAFVLLTFDRWWKVYGSMYFIGHVIFCSWPIVFMLIQPLLIRETRPKKD